MIPEKGRPTYKIAAFFPTHEDLGPMKTLGHEWQAAFRVAVELVNSGPFKVAFTYVLPRGGYDSDSCGREARVRDCLINALIFACSDLAWSFNSGYQIRNRPALCSHFL